MDPDDLYAASLASFQSGDWGDAVEGFGLLIRQAPGHPRIPDAYIHMARAHTERNERLTAIADYELFLTLFPAHGLAPEASFGICQTYAELSPIPQRDQAYTREAIQSCSETWLRFRGLNLADEAGVIRDAMWDKLAQKEFEEGRQYERRGGVDSAILVYESVVQNYPDTRWAPRAILAMYRAYRDLEWEDEAEEESARLVRLYPDSEAATELRQELGDRDPFAGL
jgi:outer membrane protein assembly factor BamD